MRAERAARQEVGLVQHGEPGVQAATSETAIIPSRPSLMCISVPTPQPRPLRHQVIVHVQDTLNQPSALPANQGFPRVVMCEVKEHGEAALGADRGHT